MSTARQTLKSNSPNCALLLMYTEQCEHNNYRYDTGENIFNPLGASYLGWVYNGHFVFSYFGLTSCRPFTLLLYHTRFRCQTRFIALLVDNYLTLFLAFPAFLASLFALLASPLLIPPRFPIFFIYLLPLSAVFLPPLLFCFFVNIVILILHCPTLHKEMEREYQTLCRCVYSMCRKLCLYLSW